MANSYRNKLTQLKDNEHPFAHYVRILGKGKTGTRSLHYQEAFDAMTMILSGEVEDIQLGAFLMLLRVKEESVEELTGFVQAVRNYINAPQNIHVDLDWSSYAGKKRQLPWYLLSCLVLADQHIRVVMHGASGHTAGRLYSEQVLQQLNIPTATNWQQLAEQLDLNYFSFMSLEHLCPPLKNIIDLRNYLGLRSPVHTLSRLINPLSAAYSMQSIFHPAYGISHQQAAISLEQPNAAVFKGEGGEIERKPEATCLVKTITNGVASEETWPKLVEGRQAHNTLLDVNHLREVWRGDKKDDYANQAILGTLAIAIKCLGRANNQQQAFELAEHYWQARNLDRL